MSLPRFSRFLRFARVACLALTVGCTTLPGILPAGGTNPPASGMARRLPGQMPPAIGNGDIGRAPANGRTLLAIYMVGSDLEDDVNPRNGIPDEREGGQPSKVGAGTSDLQEILLGYHDRLTPAERANVDVLVAFGGARKQGWQGIKYADLATLTRDARDGYFGNDPSYLHADPQADMGSEATFKAFLDQVKGRAQGTGKVFVNLWDHGGSFIGIGPDTNSDQTLSLTAMRRALAASGLQADLVGFDACLMASLEVANAMRGHFAYMVASEELEPGHGWDYTPIVEFMGKQPQATAVGLGKAVVDSFIDSPNHQQTNGRTLSLVDLTRVDAVTRAVDAWSASGAASLQSSYEPVLASVKAAQHYGASARGEGLAIDLAHFADRLRTSHPASAAVATGIETAVKQAVVYARHNGDKPDSNGLSIYSLANPTVYTRKLYTDTNAASSPWFAYVRAFLGHGLNDTVPPRVRELSPGIWQITDNVGLHSVDTVYMRMLDEGRRIAVIATEPAAPQPGSIYALPEWDGTAIHLVSGGEAIEMPYAFDSHTANGTLVYVAGARWNGQDMDMYIEYDEATEALVDIWLVPAAGDDDEFGVPRAQYAPQAGDRLAFYRPVFDLESGGESFEPGREIILGGDFGFEERPIAGDKLYFLMADDLKGNVSTTGPMPPQAG